MGFNGNLNVSLNFSELIGVGDVFTQHTYSFLVFYLNGSKFNKFSSNVKLDELELEFELALTLLIIISKLFSYSFILIVDNGSMYNYGNLRLIESLLVYS